MLYAFGSNGSGQLGIGHVEDVSEPTPSFEGSKGLPIRDLKCGGNHTLLFMKDGTVHATGDNHDGRCGITWDDSFVQPRDVTLDGTKSAKALEADCVAATWAASIFVESGGEKVSVCGTGESGELGLGEGVKIAKERTAMEGFPPKGTTVVHLAACMAHVVALLSNGEVWGWGKGRKGQLGEPCEDVWRPRRIEGIPFRVETAVCGKDFTCVLGHATSGELLLLGPNGKDRFGVKANAPSAVPGWEFATASWGSVFILMKTGKIVAWGRNDHGQLPPHCLPQIARLVAGSEHCVAITSDRRIIAWGWGEHGNCGSHIDQQGDVKHRYNVLTVRGKAKDVFAGCATSFISTLDP